MSVQRAPIRRGFDVRARVTPPIVRPEIDKRRRRAFPLRRRGGIMLALVDFSGTTTAYILQYDNGWTLIASLTDGLAEGAAEGVFASTFAIKAPNGQYVINVDPETSAYPDLAWGSTDKGVNWSGIFIDNDANGHAATVSADGTVWGFKTDGGSIYKIFKDGVASYTFPDDKHVPFHIAAHPTDADVVAVKGVRGYEPETGPGSDNDHAIFAITIDGGSSWNLVETTEEQEENNNSREHKNLHFTNTGRLVCLSDIEFFGESEGDTMYIRYADPPYTSFTTVHEASLWQLPAAGDDDWSGGPTTGAVTGTSRKLFFLGNTTGTGPATDSHVFMSQDNAESWVELEQPDPGLTGLHYDDVKDILYGLVHAIDSTGVVLLRMQHPSESASWEDVTSGIPITLTSDTFPFTQQAIWAR